MRSLAKWKTQKPPRRPKAKIHRVAEMMRAVHVIPEQDFPEQDFPEAVRVNWEAELAVAEEVDFPALAAVADLTPGLTRHYRALVTSLKDVGAVVEYVHGRDHVVVDDAFRRGFEVALKERVAEDVSLVGHLDAVNAHRAPFTFYVYPKLEEGDRVECHFQPEMLQLVAELLKKTVRVAGTGYFAPVGIYPLRMEVREAPRALAWDPSILRSYVGTLRLVPKGMSVSDYLEANRKAAGFAD